MKIVVIDDDKVVLNALSKIIESDGIEIAATGQSGAESLKLYREHRPDMVLMDIRMEGVSGIDATQIIMAQFPDAKILLLTTFKDEESIAKAINLGAKGYILKDNFAAILPSIRAVVQGNMVFDADIISSIGKGSSNTPGDIPLSPRELSVISLVAEGFDNKEIAQKLFLGEGTVRNYVSLILEKLSLRDRTQLAIYYLNKLNQG